MTVLMTVTIFMHFKFVAGILSSKTIFSSLLLLRSNAKRSSTEQW